ncbi:aspartate/glutamate racemase family protein [Adlercreutzia sp. ZJ141]|uniref:aspartate/glutamate racemase family protein n=1 Tax=Adlercreutzia sp. ZJ141 TaxID=2709406 RepID=UPI0013EA495A|nr:amino acid racemase [Adlercreutzia sp. ZJ141]
MEKLGIIGGLGPAATVRLMARVIDFTQADCDQEHLDITVLCRPQIPDRTAYLLRKPGAVSFIEPMQQAARELQDAGCTVLVTPCNTAHSRLPVIARAVDRARFVSMPLETARYAAKLGCTRCGVLATDGARQAGVYDQALAQAGVQIAWPNEDGQREVMAVIYDEVKAGRSLCPKRIEALCAQLIADGCDGIILGCTELSVLGVQTWLGAVPVIDALDVAAWRCVQECGANIRFDPVPHRAGMPTDGVPAEGVSAEGAPIEGRR